MRKRESVIELHRTNCKLNSIFESVIFTTLEQRSRLLPHGLLLWVADVPSQMIAERIPGWLSGPTFSSVRWGGGVKWTCQSTELARGVAERRLGPQESGGVGVVGGRNDPHAWGLAGPGGT